MQGLVFPRHITGGRLTEIGRMWLRKDLPAMLMVVVAALMLRLDAMLC